MRIREILAAGIAVVAFAVPAVAEEILPLTVGSYWTYQTGEEQEIWRVTGTTMIGETEVFVMAHEGIAEARESYWTNTTEGGVFSWGTRDGQRRRWYDPPIPAVDGPVHTGKRWEQVITVTETNPDTSYQWSLSAEVVDMALHTVPAGEFQAVRIDLWWMPDDNTETWWWAPSVGLLDNGHVQLLSYWFTPTQPTTWGRVKAVYRGR